MSKPLARVKSGFITDTDFSVFGLNDGEIAQHIQNAEIEPEPTSMADYLSRKGISVPRRAPAPITPITPMYPADPAPIFTTRPESRTHFVLTPRETSLISVPSQMIDDNLYSWASMLIPSSLPFTHRYRLENAITDLIRSYSMLGHNRMAIKNEIRSLIEDAVSSSSSRPRSTPRSKPKSKPRPRSRSKPRSKSKSKSKSKSRKTKAKK